MWLIVYARALWRSLCPAQWVYLLAGGLLALWILTGCGGAGVDASPPEVAGGVGVVSTAVSPTPTLPALPLPTVIVREGYPSQQADNMSGGYPSGTPNNAPPTPTAVATITPIPLTEPTVSIIAPPTTEFAGNSQDSPNGEHFWFRRPIPEGGVVWTNKHYPYGGTRSGTLRPHHGVEFDVPYNTPIYAAAEGTVVFAGSDASELIGPDPNFYGNVIVIEHPFASNGQRVYTLYAHLQEVYVRVGERINMDVPIGLSGATGVADGPHLHFEVRLGANDYMNTRNPMLWLLPFPGRGAIVGRVVDSQGNLLQEAPIALLPMAETGTTHSASTGSYAGNTVNGDDLWQENFAFDDVPAGFYEVLVREGNRKFRAEVWVVPNQVSVVELVVGE
jgi:murein DD-endopeptidase MepM/ murein hydrolase activator NlpD